MTNELINRLLNKQHIANDMEHHSLHHIIQLN